jgi:hypothetical protein
VRRFELFRRKTLIAIYGGTAAPPDVLAQLADD